VALRAGAVDPDTLEQILAALGRVIDKRQGREIDLLLPSKRALEGIERLQLGLGRQAEIHPLHAIQGLGEMLYDGADRKLAQRAVPGRAVGRPAQGIHGLGAVREDLIRIRVVIRGHRDGQAQRVRHAAQHGRAIEAVHILADQGVLAQGLAVLQLGQIGVGLGHEQRVALGQLRDERRVEREVVGCRVAGCAGATIAVERFFREQLASPLDQLLLRLGRLDHTWNAGGEHPRYDDCTDISHLWGELHRCLPDMTEGADPLPKEPTSPSASDGARSRGGAG
jgi:hypothetical protein